MTRESTQFAAPFPGLRPFEFSEAPLFYGRGAHIVGMLKILRKHHFLAVVGSSGCGKSSLVRAGLLPALDHGYLGNCDADWHFVIMKPGGDPFGDLARSLVNESQFELADETVASCRDTLRRGPRGLLDAVDRYLPSENGTVLVLADQFEEIFRFTHRDRDALSHDQEVDPAGLDDAIAFVDLLLSTAEEKLSGVYVALTMRSDFLGECDAFRDLPEAINRSQFLPPRLACEELRDAIERPPQNPQFDGPPDENGTITKSQIDPEVVSELLAAMEDRQDQLPLIQHALMRMWSVAEGPDRIRPAQINLDIMRRCGMEDSSGVAGALDQHADMIYRGLGKDRLKEIARWMFCALCRQGGDGRRVRRVCTVAEIAAVAGKDVAVEDVIDVATEFTASGCNFLVATPPGELTAASTLDISHESLIRNWQRLGRWLDAEEESATRYRRLAESARLHEEDREEPLIGRALEVATEWFEQERPTAAWGERYAPGAFNHVEKFLRLSQKLEREREAKRQQEERDRAEAKERELRLANELAEARGKRVETFLRMLIAAVVATAVACILAVVAFSARREAKLQEKTAIQEKKNTEDALERLEIESTQSKAAALMAGLGGRSDYPTINEYESLRLLAESDWDTQLTFMEQLLTSAGKAEALRPRYAYLLHAIVGLDVQEKVKIKDLLAEYGRDPSRTNKAISVAVAELGMLLAVDDADFNRTVADCFLAAMEKTTDYNELSSLGQALGRLGEKLPAEQALAVAQQIVAAMEKRGDRDAMSSHGKALGGLGEKLPAEQALAVAQQIVAAMEKTANSSALRYFGEALGRLGEKLPAEQALAVAHLIVAAMEKTTNSSALSSLGEALNSLGEKLPAEQALAVAQRIVAAIEKTDDSYACYSLGETLGSLGEKLPAEQALACAQQIVAAMKRKGVQHALSFLGEALGSLGEKLPAEQALACAQQIVAAMEKTTDPYDLSRLGRALGRLGAKLPAEQALAGAQQIVADMEETTYSSALSSLGEALGGLGAMLPAEQALAGAQQIVAAMEKTTDPADLSSLGTALGRLGAKLPAEQALAGAQQILAAMEKTDNPDAVSSLGTALGRLGEKLPAEQALAVAQLIVAGMEKTTDYYDLSPLGNALGGLGAELPAEQALVGAQQIVAAMEKTTNPSDLSRLSETLGGLGEKLPAEQALAGAQQIVAAMEKTTNSSALSSLGKTLGRLGEKLPAEQALAVAQLIVAVVEKTTYSSALSSLGEALGRLGEKLPAEQALAVAQQIVAAMEKTTDYDELSSLGTALGSLGEKLPAEQALAGAQQIVAVMEKKTNSYALSRLGNALGGLGERLPAEQALAGAQQILAAMEKTTDSYDLFSLGEALGGLGERLPAEQALAGAQQILAAMEKTTDSYDLFSLDKALGRLGERLPAEQALAGAQQIVAAMGKKTDPDDLSRLGRALGRLGAKLPAEQALAVAQQIVAAMEKKTDPDDLSSLGHALAVSMEVKDTCSVLKSIVCVGEMRMGVLAGLGMKTGQEFDGNLWKAVDWLREQGTDVKNVPRFPIINQE